MIKKLKSLLIIVILIGCGSDASEEKEKFSYERTKPNNIMETVSINEDVNTNASDLVDLSNKGIGPIKKIILNSEVNHGLAQTGADIYKKMCTACHKIGKKFIGPAPNGILGRRTPEWVMNMILNPEEMVINDPIAKDLLIKFNGAPMANQNLDEDQARAILEYFRTLD
ncbi:MAG: cytochrome c [Pelagibacterales bacterium]|nr:cytochrome c [Pelagibacterales bacterium]|tara:strand:+ start:76 stop:582 length:507 start_codon:yes stop_codon:yes gene_type:complete